MMAFARNGVVVANTDHLAIAGQKPRGLAAQGSVIWQFVSWRWIAGVHTLVGARDTTAAIDTTGADLLVITAPFYDNTPTNALGVTDNRGNTWSLAFTRLGSPPQAQLSILYSKPTSVGPGHTFSKAGPVAMWSLSVGAFSGSAANPMDQFVGANGAGTGTLTPSAANCLVVAGLYANGDATAITGLYADTFTLMLVAPYGSGSHPGGGLGYAIQKAAAPIGATWTVPTPIVSGAVSFLPG